MNTHEICQLEESTLCLPYSEHRLEVSVENIKELIVRVSAMGAAAEVADARTPYANPQVKKSDVTRAKANVHCLRVRSVPVHRPPELPVQNPAGSQVNSPVTP